MVEAGTLWVPSNTEGASEIDAVGHMSSAVRHSAPEKVRSETDKLFHYEAHQL